MRVNSGTDEPGQPRLRFERGTLVYRDGDNSGDDPVNGKEDIRPRLIDIREFIDQEEK